jgi:Outer membrane protein Omp28
MKRLGYAALLVLLLGCEEKPVVIPDLQIGDRRVLVEELTGVRCQNCPAGAADLEDLRTTLGDRLIVVALHAAASFDTPYSDSRYDFRTADGRAIADYIYVNGDPGAPAAAVDRRALSNQTEYFINRPWKGSINAQAAVAPETGIFVQPNFNVATRQLDMTVNIAPDQPFNGDLRLSVFITEDSIQDIQQKGAEKIYDYWHRFVFRDAVTAPTGDQIATEMSTGQPFSKNYSVTLPPDWVARHCHVVAFVSLNGSKTNSSGELQENNYVLQATEVPVQ